MTEDESKYCDEMRELFSTEGWEWIKAECHTAIESYTSIDNIQTVDALHFSKGVLFMARTILSLPDAVVDIEEAEEFDDAFDF